MSKMNGLQKKNDMHINLENIENSFLHKENSSGILAKFFYKVKENNIAKVYYEFYDKKSFRKKL